MTLLDFIILSLATWRISSLFTNDSEAGPFHLLDWIRYAAGVRVNEQNEAYATNELAKLFTCLWCFSIYLGVGFTLFYWYAPVLAVWIALPFALSAVSIMVDKWTL